MLENFLSLSLMSDLGGFSFLISGGLENSYIYREEGFGDKGSFIIGILLDCLMKSGSDKIFNSSMSGLDLDLESVDEKVFYEFIFKTLKGVYISNTYSGLVSTPATYIFFMLSLILYIIGVQLFFCKTNLFSKKGFGLFMDIGFSVMISLVVFFTDSLSVLLFFLVLMSYYSVYLVMNGYGVSWKVLNVLFFKLLADLFLLLYLGFMLISNHTFVVISEFSLMGLNPSFDLFLMMPMLIYSLFSVFGFWIYWAMEASHFISSYLHSVGFISVGVIVLGKLFSLGVFDGKVWLVYLLVLLSILNFVIFLFLGVVTKDLKKSYGYFSSSSISYLVMMTLVSPTFSFVYMMVTSILKMFFFNMLGYMSKDLLSVEKIFLVLFFNLLEVVFYSMGVYLLSFSSTGCLEVLSDVVVVFFIFKLFFLTFFIFKVYYFYSYKGFGVGFESLFLSFLKWGLVFMVLFYKLFGVMFFSISVFGVKGFKMSGVSMHLNLVILFLVLFSFLGCYFFWGKGGFYRVKSLVSTFMDFFLYKVLELIFIFSSSGLKFYFFKALSFFNDKSKGWVDLYQLGFSDLCFFLFLMFVMGGFLVL